MKSAKFLSGSTFRHVVLMSLSNSVGLVALFLVDLVDIYFLSLLGETALASAVGYAGTILFFTTSICIGFSIAIGALVSQSIGAGKITQAKRFLINGYVLAFAVTCILALFIWLSIAYWVELLGATGRARELSIDYLQIMIPSMPILALGISSGATLRAVGDARRSMFSTLTGGAVNAILDPIFIFLLDMGVEGAATASVCARATILACALYPVWRKHDLIIAFNFWQLLPDIKELFRIAIPAIVTNIATPFGMAYVTASMAQYGDGAVAGLSITGRIAPVAFGVIFAVSGAIGPIIGQNFGSLLFDRVQSTIKDALQFVFWYVCSISTILFFIPHWIGYVFSADLQAQQVINAFCWYVAITYILTGATYVGNAAFNNLGLPHYSTVINLGKATVGTIPFVYIGSEYFGAQGVIIGQAVGACFFGIISIIVVYIMVGRLKEVQQKSFKS